MTAEEPHRIAPGGHQPPHPPRLQIAFSFGNWPAFDIGPDPRSARTGTLAGRTAFGPQRVVVPIIAEDNSCDQRHIFSFGSSSAQPSAPGSSSDCGSLPISFSESCRPNPAEAAAQPDAPILTVDGRPQRATVFRRRALPNMVRPLPKREPDSHQEITGLLVCVGESRRAADDRAIGFGLK